MDVGRLAVVSMAAGDGLGDAFQAGTDFGDRALALLLTDFLIGAAEDEDEAAGAILFGSILAEHLFGHFVLRMILLLRAIHLARHIFLAIQLASFA